MYGFDKHKHLKSLTTLYAPVKIKKNSIRQKGNGVKRQILRKKKIYPPKHDSNKLNE